MKHSQNGWIVGIALIFLTSIFLVGCATSPTSPASRLVDKEFPDVRASTPWPIDWPTAAIVVGVDGNSYIAFSPDQKEELASARLYCENNYEAARLNAELVAALVQERAELMLMIRYLEEELDSTRGNLFPKEFMLLGIGILGLFAGAAL